MALEGCRPALADDIPRLGELARVAIAELEPLRGGAVWRAAEARTEPVEDSLGAAIADPAHLVVAGTFDDFIVGYGVVRLQELLVSGFLGVVDDIFVEPGARGVGVGEAMMDEMVRWCRERRCIGVDAMALPGARETKNFFEDSGFTARQLVMHHRLTDDTSQVEEQR